MSEKNKKFGEELDALIAEGKDLLIAITYDCTSEQDRDFIFQKLVELHDYNKEIYEKKVEVINDFLFIKSYESWYSKAHAVIKQVLPGRLADFIWYYRYPHERKSINYSNYMIHDYLQDLEITNGLNEIIVNGSAAIPKFQQQLCIINAAKDALNSILIDIRADLQADLFNTEIDAANALMKEEQLRAAGAICGVVLEKHLGHVCNTHNIRIMKKNPSINVFISNLYSSKIITTAQQHFIQSLAATRNICCHAKDREPNKNEVVDLIEGTSKILKTIF